MQNRSKELKSIVSQFADAYKMTCDRSWNDYVKTLTPGTMLPPKGRIYGEDKRAEFESLCQDYRVRVDKVLDEVLVGLNRKMTEAPSTEAVNTITLLNMRQNVDEIEIGNLLTKYGDNPQSWKALVDIASAHNIHVWDAHPVEKQIDGIENLRSSLGRVISRTSAEAGHTSDAYISVVCMDIDNAFTEGE